jgi:hypothetical protein
MEMPMTSTQKIIRQLRREYPGSEIGFTGKGHIKLRLLDGRVFTMAASPSDGNFLKQIRRGIRKYGKPSNAG